MRGRHDENHVLGVQGVHLEPHVFALKRKHNRAGAAGIIAHQAAKDSAADGYAILTGSGATLAINPSLYRKLPYDPVKDFEPIVATGGGPLYLFTSSTKPVNDLKDFIAYVKANPGKVTHGSGGNGITSHIAMEMLKKAANVDLLHVPYKGAPAVVTDIIGGQIDFAFDAGPSILPHAKSGRVKLLGVSSARRWPGTPEVPTLAEQGISGFEALTWVALLAPKGTPTAVVERLNAAANKALKSPEVTAQKETVGLAAKGGTPAELQAFIKSEMARWGNASSAWSSPEWSPTSGVAGNGSWRLLSSRRLSATCMRTRAPSKSPLSSGSS